MFSGKPENVGLEKHYHTFEKPNGSKDTNTIENYFCDVWEGPASKILKAIRGGTFPDGENRQFFACFLGLSFVRSPNHRANVDYLIADIARTTAKFSASDPERFRQSLSNYEKNMGDQLTDDPEGLRCFILEGQYKVTARPETYLKMFVDHGVRIGLVIEKMRWQFVRATERFRYLTSDNPFFFNDPTADLHSTWSGTGLLNKNVEASFPVEKNLALIATWREDLAEGFVQGTHEIVKTVNRRTALSANRFVYASEYSDAISRLVNKHAKSHPRIVIG